MNFAERFVQAAAKKFGEPEKECSKNGESSRDAHHQMEMAGDEVVRDGSGGEIVACEKNPGESAGEKKRNETQHKKHGGVELDARVPQCAEPTDQENRGGPSERRSQQGKGIHAAREHVLAPNAKTEEPHAAQRQNYPALLPNRFAGKGGNQMRDEAETRKHGHVDFCFGEKPEEALPKHGSGTWHSADRPTGKESKWRKQVRAQEAIGEQANASRQENAENQHAQDGVEEPSPDGQGKPGEGHALGAQVDSGDAEIERVEEGRGTEDGHADDPEGDGGVMPELREDEKRTRQANERGHRRPEREEVQRGESHIARADLQRQKIVSEAGLGGRSEHQKNHQRTMERGERRKTIRRIAKAGQQR